MLEILPAPAHVGAYRFEGTLTAADYDRCIADVEARLAAHARIGLYCDLRAFTGITPAALVRDLRYGLGKVGQFDRFARGAIVTGRPWLARVTRIAGRMFPRSDIRSFEADAATAAMAWVSAVDPGAAPAPGPRR